MMVCYSFGSSKNKTTMILTMNVREDGYTLS